MSTGEAKISYLFVTKTCCQMETRNFPNQTKANWQYKCNDKLLNTLQNEKKSMSSNLQSPLIRNSYHGNEMMNEYDGSEEFCHSSHKFSEKHKKNFK